MIKRLCVEGTQFRFRNQERPNWGAELRFLRNDSVSQYLLNHVSSELLGSMVASPEGTQDHRGECRGQHESNQIPRIRARRSDVQDNEYHAADRS
jgi:hypothetical protein